MTNIRFAYLYRDASNYKQQDEVILSNETQRAVGVIDQQVRSHLSDGSFFIARQVQLEERFFTVVNEDDHPWHEFVQVESTTDPIFDPVPEVKRDIAQFLHELEQAHQAGWDETQVRADLIQQIEKEKEALKRWLASKVKSTYGDDHEKYL